MRRALLPGFLCVLTCLGACARMPPLRAYEGAERGPAERAELVVPELVEVLTLDGQEVKGLRRVVGPRERTLLLAPGHHALVVRYVVVYDFDEQDDHTTFRSEPVGLAFDADAGQSYRIHCQTGMPDEGVMGQGTRVDIKVAFQVEAEATGAAVATETRPVIPRKKVATVQPGGPPAPASSTLKHYWDEASEEERTEFLKAIASSP